MITLGGLYEERIKTPSGGGVQEIEHAFRVFAGNELVAEETFEELSAVTDRVWVHSDRLGSATLVLNVDGSVRHRLRFDPWGKRIDDTGSPTSGPPSPFLFGFTGHEHDDDLGLVNMKGRLYDPKLRRMLSPDPLASSATNSGIHPYAYALNDPINVPDPSGYCASGPSGGFDEVEGQWYEWCNPKDGGTSQDGRVSVTTWDGVEVDGPPPPPPSPDTTAGGVDFIGGATSNGGELGTQLSIGVSDQSRTSTTEQATVFPGGGRSGGTGAEPDEVVQFAQMVNAHINARIVGIQKMAFDVECATGKTCGAGGQAFEILMAVLPFIKGGKLAKLLGEVGVFGKAARGGLRPIARSLGAAGDDLLLKKAVNSNLPHAAARGVERGVFGSADEAADALRGLTDQITRSGTFPSGTLVDTAREGRFLVPVGNNGMAVYQLAKNGTAKLKTVLIGH